jgi:hypothetical protein
MIPQEFKDKVKEYIDSIENETWARDVTLFSAKQLFDAGYDAVVAIDEDDMWRNKMTVIKVEEQESEEWHFGETWLDIFAVDKKADPIIFDDRINERDFAAAKMLEIIECKVNLVAGALEGRTAGQVYDNFPEKFNKIAERRKSYEPNVG